MNIADAVNPFFFQWDTPPLKDAATQLITQAGQTTIYSAVDQVVLANTLALAQYATIVKDENDLTVYGLDVTIAGDLLHQDRGPSASRNIRIYCRTLTVLETSDKVTTIDVSAYVDEARASHLQPDIPAVLANASQRAAAGDDIAFALNNRGKGGAFSQWFQNDPGGGWATPGAKGGCIDIACETLVLHQKLSLKANGGRGNAGVGGQNVKNWMPGLIGGDAGRGGQGGDSGTVRLVCNAVVDKNGAALNLIDWVDAECDAGEEGDAGLPGSAYDPNQQNRHFGSYAGSVPPGQSEDAALVVPDPLVYLDADGAEHTIADASQVAACADPHFWALLYHRIKLAYLQNQPHKFKLPAATDPDWVALGALVTWGNRFGFAYGDTDKAFRAACCGDVLGDPAADAKNTVARALKVMNAWYVSGKTMWGFDVTTVSPLPLATLCSYVDTYFVHQKDVRDMYIRLRTQLADAIKSNADLATMSNSAEYAVQMHKAAVEDLRKMIFGGTDNSGVDAVSLLGELNAADSACNVGIAKLSTDLSSLDDKIKSAIGIGISDVLGSLKSMLFVAGDPPAFLAMGGAEAYGLYDKAKNDVTDDTGNSMAKDAVIKQIHQLKGSVDDLSKMANAMVANDQVGNLDQAILTSLDNVDAYVSKFTTALGDVGQSVLDEIAELRQKVNYKNGVWSDYNDRIYQLAKEWDDYQTALAKKQQIDTSTQQELSAGLVDTVQLYTGIYLNNLERTADLWAKLLRKFAYVTLDAPMPDADYLGGSSAFWNADAASAQAMADQSDGNWDVNKNAVVGSQDSSSIRYQLTQYNAGSQAIVIRAPDPSAENKKSTFYIAIRGDGSDADRALIAKLLAHRTVWLQVLPPASFKGKYLGPNGWPADPPKPGDAVFAYPLISGNDWDVRITHVNPWIEGVGTNTGTVQFHIKLGVQSYIIDAGAVAHYYTYDNKAVNTQFAHLTDTPLSDPTNDGMAGDAAGEVSDENIDKRGIFVQLQLSIPDGGLNAGLAAAGDIAKVNLHIHFRVIFRAAA